MSEFKTPYICPFCNAGIEGEVMNGAYGCDTGCEYVSVDIECPSCHKVVWSSGTFGYFENAEEEAEYREEFMQEFAKELDKIISTQEPKS